MARLAGNRAEAVHFSKRIIQALRKAYISRDIALGGAIGEWAYADTFVMIHHSYKYTCICSLTNPSTQVHSYCLFKKEWIDIFTTRTGMNTILPTHIILRVRTIYACMPGRCLTNIWGIAVIRTLLLLVHTQPKVSIRYCCPSYCTCQRSGPVQGNYPFGIF